MHAPNRPIGLSFFVSLVSQFLQIALILNVLSPLVWPQEKTPDDASVYIPGKSAEDRLKMAEKRSIARPDNPSSPLTAPANDNFANASGFIGSGGGGSTAATNIDATGETGEPIHGAGTGGTGSAKNSIWYSFTASQTRVITIWTATGGTSPIDDTVLSAYQGGSVGSLLSVAHNDDYPGRGLYSQITFTTVANQTYHVAVDGYSTAIGTFFVHYLSTTAAPNDLFIQMPVFNNTESPFIGITGSNVNATSEPGEPNHANNNGTLNSIWYGWTAPANLSMTFETLGSSFDATLSVYTGSSVSGLMLIANDNNDGFGSSARVTFIASAGVTYRIAIEGFASEVGNSLLNWRINRAESGRQLDFDLDLKTDYSVFRPSNNVWYNLLTSTGGFQFTQWGLAGDILVPGADYDGDTKADIGVWRPSNGVFYALRSSTGTLMALQWGISGDIPVQGDFDGDDRSDFAVWRPATGIFYVYQSELQTMLAYQWGLSTDKVAPGDYDGDGMTDFAVWRPSNGVFYVVRSSDGASSFVQWGLNGDQVVPGDYDRDGKNDTAVYRPSTNVFYARRSSDGALFALQWGLNGDVFAPGDYDGNGMSDVCVWRPSDGNFYVNRNGSSLTMVVHWGQSGDVPISSSNVH